jgi:hypothetical protein
MLALFLGRFCRLASLYQNDVRMGDIENILDYMSYVGQDMDFFDRKTLAEEHFKFVKEECK